MFVTYRGGNSHRDPRFYADRHMPKPAMHHNAPAVHRHAPAPAPHHGKPAVAHNDRYGSERHMAMALQKDSRGISAMRFLVLFLRNMC